MTPNENQLEALLKLAAQRMGTTPQALKDAAQRGDLSHLAGNASGQDAANLRKVLSDPEAAKKLLAMDYDNLAVKETTIVG